MTVAKVFISYRRIPSAMLATLLNEKLKVQGIDAYVDTRRTDGGGPFPNRLLNAIEDSDVFICLLADTTLDSDWVRREIEHAYSQAKPMIPVFQESYIPLATPTTSSISTLLQSDGIHVLDVKNLYVDQAVADLARMIKLTLGIEVSHAGDTTEIGERTYNLRPAQPKSRRWLWLVVALLIIVLGIFLFQWVNGPIISAGVAGTQTAVALANETTMALLNQTETQEFFAGQTATLFNPFTPTPSLTLTDTPTATPVQPTDVPTNTATPSQTPTTAPMATSTSEMAILIIDAENIPVRSAPTSNSEIIGRVSSQTFSLTGVSASGVYYRVEFNGQQGWVWRGHGTLEGSTGNLPMINAPVLIIDAENIPVRSAPTSNSEIIGRVSSQTFSLTGVSASGVYYRVEFNGQRGWIWRGHGNVEGDLSSVPIVYDNE